MNSKLEIYPNHSLLFEKICSHRNLFWHSYSYYQMKSPVQRKENVSMFATLASPNLMDCQRSLQKSPNRSIIATCNNSNRDRCIAKLQWIDILVEYIK